MGKTQKGRTEKSIRILHWPPILLTIVITVTLTFVSVVLIYLDLKPSSCFSANCLYNALEIFNLPLKILAAGIIAFSLLLAYLRAKMTYEQLERQYKQDVISNYQAQKDSFKDLLEESHKHHEFTVIKINYEWLYSFLYLDSKKGDFTLRKDVVENLVSEIPAYYSALEQLVSISNTDRFYTSQYKDIYELYNQVNESIPISHSKNFDESNALLFTNTQSNVALIALIKDITELAKVINAAEMWQHFDHKVIAEWSEIQKKLEINMDEASEIQSYLTSFKNNSKKIKRWFDDYKPELHSGRDDDLIKFVSFSNSAKQNQKELLYELLLSEKKNLIYECIDNIRELFNIADNYHPSIHIQHLLKLKC